MGIKHKTRAPGTKINTSAVWGEDHEIEGGTIGTTEIANSSVTTAKIVDGAVTTEKIADNSITSAKVAADVLLAEDIATGAITAVELGDNAVDTAAIQDNAVTNIKMADNSVGTAEIIDDSVTNVKMADNAINTAELVDNAVTSAKIADAAVLPCKTVSLGAGGDYQCDGVNDEVQIQAAIDAVNAAGGGVVFIKPGTYSNSAVTVKTNVLLILSKKCSLTAHTLTTEGTGYVLNLSRTFHLDSIRAMPFIIDSNGLAYDGTWFKMVGSVGTYPAYVSGQSIQRRGYLLASVQAKVATTESNIVMFWYEPYKGDYANFQGMGHDGTGHYAKSRNGGAETNTYLSGQDWTVETKFSIRHEYDQSEVKFYTASNLVATHTTNISAQPYEIQCCEPANVAKNVYMKYPPGMYFGS